MEGLGLKKKKQKLKTVHSVPVLMIVGNRLPCVSHEKNTVCANNMMKYCT